MVRTEFYYKLYHRKSNQNPNYVVAKLDLVNDFVADTPDAWRTLVGPKAMTDANHLAVLRGYRAPFWFPYSLGITQIDTGNRLVGWLDTLFYRANSVDNNLTIERVLNSFYSHQALTSSLAMRTEPQPILVSRGESTIVDKIINRAIPPDKAGIVLDVSSDWQRVLTTQPENISFIPLAVSTRTENSAVSQRVRKTISIEFAHKADTFREKFICEMGTTSQQQITAAFAYYLQMMHEPMSTEARAIRDTLHTGPVSIQWTGLSTMTMASANAAYIDLRFAEIIPLLARQLPKTITSKDVLILKERLSHALSHLRK